LVARQQPQTKKRATNGRPYKKFGRDVVFSADLCYNGTNKSLPPGGRWHGVAVTEGACVTLSLDNFIVTRSPSVAGRFASRTAATAPAVSKASAVSEASALEGAYERACASLGVWVLPDARVACNAVIQRRN